MSDIIRVSAEKSTYEIKHCLNETISTSSILEQKGKLKELENRVNTAFKMKMVSEFGVIASAGQLYRSFYEDIYARAFGHLFLNRRYDDPQEVAKAILHSFPIPPAFHDDLILRRYICPITLEPIRYPVEDPTTRHRQ